MTGCYYYLSWYFFTQRETKNQLKDGESLITAGFKQVFRTSKGIFQFYPRTVGLFFVGVTFTEASKLSCRVNDSASLVQTSFGLQYLPSIEVFSHYVVSFRDPNYIAMISFITTSVTYMVEVLKINSSKIGIIFLITLFSTIPGAVLANWLSNKTNPLMALKINIILLSGINVALYLNVKDPSDANLMYGVAFVWGAVAGWYYPIEKMIFSMIIPSGQESELTGFFLNCTRILSWLPPLVFTVINEAGIHLSWAGLHMNIYLLIGFLLFMFMPDWQTCIQIAQQVNMMKQNQSRLDDGG